jgi:hypothetical protein
LTADVVGEAKKLLGALGSVALVTPMPPVELVAEDFEQAETDLWAWYLEWSEIARTAIKQKQLLRALGFRRDTGGEESDEPEAPPVAPALPAPTF